MPSCASFIQVSTETLGFRKSFFAESFTRAQCKSKSGVTPSNARAPSNTIEHSQAACVRTPMIGVFPSRHWSSKKVQVFDQFVAAAMRTLLTFFVSGYCEDGIHFRNLRCES